jgi:Outer membrane protein beta-barrel domain
MKKIFTYSIAKILVIGLLISFSQSAFAQSGIRLGIRGGAHAGTQWGRAIIYNPKGTLIGFHGAIFADIPLSEDISICPEISYVQKGFKMDSTEFTSNYIDVPLLVKIQMGDEGLYTIIGPYMTYQPTANPAVLNEKALSWGGTIGLGQRIGEHVILEARYNFNASIYQFANDSNNPYGFRNTTIGLSLGFLF